MSGYGFVIGGFICTLLAWPLVSGHEFSLWAAMASGFFGFVGGRFFVVAMCIREQETKMGATLLGILCALITFTIMGFSNGWF